MTQALTQKLDRLVSVYEQALRANSEPNWRVALGSPAAGTELDRVEDAIGHRLSIETRDLYEWHNGCPVWILPNLGFPSLDFALATYRLMLEVDPLPAPSNERIAIRSSQLFPILNIDKVYFSAMVTDRTAMAASSLYLVDIEASRLTNVATSINEFVAYLLRAMDGGKNLIRKKYMVDWVQDPFIFDRNMIPIGTTRAG